MSLHKEILIDSELVKELKQCWNPLSIRSGTLVQRFDGVWHYSVALSDTSAISWGPSEALQLYHQGSLVIHELGPEFKDGIQVPYLPKAEIFKDLTSSIPAFHRKWKYGVQGWNCEHWARLVVSGQPISYQVKEQGFGVLDAFGVLHFRGEAIEQLNKYKFNS
ncbi:hypothetical protein H6F90_17805 [Trichocoleus sp. FACHB-591]|uniref:hypothetical protein n=1 Tax=Trichocoleus sp. FACHB-591 TaxID=2692872 RepID=UPI0016865F0A|nr:hypothetical protein [Trichocoleus sp. FACHB-591]MBD2096959.1 hypothetical protein [Trichocoleus sp. FACHB-591]